MAVCGVIVGCDGPTSLRAGAKEKESWLKPFLKLPNGLPSRDGIRRVLRKCFKCPFRAAPVRKRRDPTAAYRSLTVAARFKPTSPEESSVSTH